MTQASDIDRRNRLHFGVGHVLAQCFRLFFRNLPRLFILCLGSVVLGGVLFFLALLAITLWGSATPLFVRAVSASFSLITPLYISVAMVSQLALDRTLGQKPRLLKYIAQTFRALLPLIGLALLASLFFSTALTLTPMGIRSELVGSGILLICLCVLCGLTLVVPAMVVERIGFRAFARTAELSKGYRWPVLGLLLLLLGLCSLLLLVPGGFFLEAVDDELGGLSFTAVLFSLAYGFGGVGVGLIYARLREIKEGARPEALAEVFD